MKNFRTAIKDSLHHSPAILLATLCSVGVAVLWASNIGALSPVINMTLNGESMQSFMEKSIESGEERVRKWESELLVAREESEIGDERSLEKNIRTEQANLAWSQWGLSTRSVSNDMLDNGAADRKYSRQALLDASK